MHPPAAHPDPRAVAAAVSFMMEEELEDLATAYDGAVVDADLAPLPVPPSPAPSHDDWKNFLLGALNREDARREHRSSRADLEPVETPIAPRRNVLDDASRVAAPTGSQLATALEKFFSRSSRGSSPSPSRSDMFAPFTSRDRHEAARASAERETRAPLEKRARRALAAVHAADFTAPARRGRDEGGDEGHPPRELPVVPVVFDALHDDSRRADRTEPVALAARMGFAPVTVPSVSVEWPRDILASVAAAVRGGTPEPIQLPTDDDDADETENGYDLRDLVRGMGAGDVHVGPPRHAGSVVAALDEMAARDARAAAVAVEIATTEEAVRRDESFQRAEHERREHARAVHMGSGGGGSGGGWGVLGGVGDGGKGRGRGRGEAHDAMDVAFFVRPGGLHPRTRADDGAGTAPPPMTSPTAREANRLVALVEARPTPPSARDRGAGVIDLTTATTTTPEPRGGGNERREPRPAPPTGFDFEPAISRRVAREISVEVIDDDDAEILDAADRAATERMAAQLAAAAAEAAAKDSDMDFIDDIAYPQPLPPPPPHAAPLREVRGDGWDHGAGFHPRSRTSRNPSPPPPHPQHPHPPHPHPHPHPHQNPRLAELDSREDDFGRRGWEDDSRRVGAVDRGRDRANEFPRVLPSSPDFSLSLRDLHPDLSLSLRDLHPDEADEPTTEVRRVVSDWRATGWRRVSPPPHARHRREPRRSPRRRASRRSTSFDLDDLDDSDGGGFFASRLRPAPRLRARGVTRSVSPQRRSRDGDDDHHPRRYLRATTTATTATMPGAAYPRSIATPGRSSRRDGTFLDSATGFDSGGRGGAFLAPHRASAVGWGTPEKLRGMSRTTREHDPARRGLDANRREREPARRGLADLGFGVASRGLVGGRRERERDAGLDEFMRMTGGYRYGA